MPSETWLGANLWYVRYWHGMYVLAGTSGARDESRAAFWTSSDGRNWQRAPDSPGLTIYDDAHAADLGEREQILGARMIDLIDRGDVLIAVAKPTWDPMHGGNGGDAGPDHTVRFRTRDGVNWRRSVQGELHPAGDDWLPAPIEFDGGWVGLWDEGAEIATSTDQHDWSVVWSGGDSAELRDLGTYSGGLLAVGAIRYGQRAQALVLSSPDGQTWSDKSRAWTDVARSGMRAFTEAGGIIVAVGLRDGTPVAWVGPPPRDD